MDLIKQIVDATPLRANDTYCPRYYYADAYHDTAVPLWAIVDSTTTGRVATEVMAMRGNAPYMWREHYLLLLDKAKALGVNTFLLEPADKILRHIEILASKNKYPSFSLVELRLWENENGNAAYAIFQRRLSRNVFTVSDHALYLTKESTDNCLAPCRLDWLGCNAMQEATAARRANAADRDGACLVDHTGNVLRTTLGNLYLTKPNGNEIIVYAVRQGRGAVADPLTAVLEDIVSNFRETDNIPMRMDYVDGFTDAMLADASSCFVCSTTAGIYPVMALDHSIKRYRVDVVRKIAIRLCQRFVF